jgi:hypothetical protein
MPPVKPVIDPDELRIEIPPRLFEKFQKEARIVIKYHPAGLWPIPPEWFRNEAFLKEILLDEAIQKQYELVLVPRR